MSWDDTDCWSRRRHAVDASICQADCRNIATSAGQSTPDEQHTRNARTHSIQSTAQSLQSSHRSTNQTPTRSPNPQRLPQSPATRSHLAHTRTRVSYDRSRVCRRARRRSELDRRCATSRLANRRLPNQRDARCNVTCTVDTRSSDLASAENSAMGLASTLAPRSAAQKAPS